MYAKNQAIIAIIWLGMKLLPENKYNYRYHQIIMMIVSQSQAYLSCLQNEVSYNGPIILYLHSKCCFHTFTPQTPLVISHVMEFSSF